MKKQENVSYILSSKDIFKMASSWNKGTRVLLDAGDVTPIPKQPTVTSGDIGSSYVSVSEAPDAAKAIPKQPEVTTSTDMSPPSEMAGGISDIVRAVLKELGYGEQGVGAVAQGQGGFQDPDEPVSTTGTWGIAAEEEAVQVPSVTAEQRTALSSMDEITKSQGTSIINNGNFSLPKLKTAVNNSIKNSKKKAMLSGIVDIEVGTDGPVSENRYTESNINNLSTERFAVGDSFNGTTLTTNDPMVGQFKHAWRRRLIRDGVMDTNGTLINYSGTNVFDSVYANRMGNGDYSSGDGDRFRGRGLVQITGRNTYQEVQNILQAKGINIDLINEPELVNDTRYALPAALAYLEYAGLTDDEAENMSARSLQKIINPSADVSVAEDRWDSAIRALRTENPTDADNLEKRNEYTAQRRVGFRGNDIDGIIGTNSDREMRRWLTSRNVNIPANATGMDLVVLVNSQP